MMLLFFPLLKSKYCGRYSARPEVPTNKTFSFKVVITEAIKLLKIKKNYSVVVIKNIHNIALFMDGIEEKDYIMLDHDDLCSDIIRHGLDPAIMYTDYIFPLTDFCKDNNINY